MSTPKLNDLQVAYEDFFSQLSNIANTIPVQPYWILAFNSFPSTGAINYYEINNLIVGYEKYYEQLQTYGGCIFAQGVNVPGEASTTSREKLTNSGYLGGQLGSGRDSPSELNVNFLETNYSFTDFVLRPWILAISRAGLKDNNLKTSATCYQLAKTPDGMKIRTQTNFVNICPTMVDSQKYDYSRNGIIERSASFSYLTYQIKTGNL